MTERVAKPRGRKKKEAARTGISIRQKTNPESDASGSTGATRIEPSRKTAAVDMPVPSPMFPVDRRYPAEVERAVTAIRYQYRTPTFYQPANVNPDALDIAFLAHYVEMNSGSRHYSPEVQWLNHLPRIHANATKPAVRLSLRAVAMAYYAKMYHDPSILLDSWRWYSVSLNAQRMSIAKLKDDEIPEEGEVLVPLIMSLYEVYCGTTTKGAMIHMQAAAKMMVLRGPSNCRTGAVWPIFKGVRNAEAHRSIIFGKSSVYAKPEWMIKPFIGMPRDAHQQLADIELLIPTAMESLEIGGSLRDFCRIPIPAHVDVEPCLELTRKLMKDLDIWAASYPNLTQVEETEDTERSSKRSASGLDIAAEHFAAPPKPDAFVALIASNYASTKLLLNMMIYKVATQAATPPSIPVANPEEYFEETSRCARAILRAAGVMERSKTPGFDLLRSLPPLISVLCVGPKEEHFREAQAMLYRWGARIGGLKAVLGPLNLAQ
ncbi:hypothetical protein DE146DRAFT_681955 [Phaeosphaeria sp. MPI-PUGE-AT-0046c]|nr:hypothetical protein DE146DRAFT_681955 [Phaeosphaeria sp. MPI-PUGE-AT-0046c]